jgi:hypothetical protein
MEADCLAMISAASAKLLRGLKLSLGVNDLCAPLSFRLRLLGRGPLHLVGKVDVLHFYQYHFDSPRLCLGVQDLLNSDVDLFPLGQELVQQDLPASTPECDLGELGSGEEIVWHFSVIARLGSITLK